MRIIKSLLLVIVGLLLVSSFTAGTAGINLLNSLPLFSRPIIKESHQTDLSIRQGYVSQKKETIRIKRGGRTIAKVLLDTPIMVAQAEREEEWGYFQFPDIIKEDGNIVVGWQMKEDSHKAYGKGGGQSLMSHDEGRTWEPLDKSYFALANRSFYLHDGSILQLYTPESKDIHSYQSFPNPIKSDKSLKMDFFLESELPEDLQGMYLKVRDNKGKVISIHGELDDPGLMRYAIDGLMPLMWWGKIVEMEDGSLVGGMYRTYYKDIEESIPKSCITFYKSIDGGYHWKALGRIPYHIEEIKDKSRIYDSTRGFSEANYEILKDGSILCVLRTGYNTPMYKSFSYDGGQHWTEPEPLTSNGVKPMLLRMDNGILVLASGRPGLQLRFCVEGDGKNWTEPIDMLTYMNGKGEYDIWGFGCGYPSLVKVGKNSFYIVYSDFKTKNEEGDYRKAIMFRKISVTK